MSHTASSHTTNARVIPDHLGTVEPDSRVYLKLVRAGTDLVLPDAYLKWYEIGLEGVDLSELAQESRALLEAESAAGRLRLENQLGFLEVHHCNYVAFLIVCTWNNNNELWQTVFIKDLDAGTPWERLNRENAGHRPVMCIWELGPAWHERNAWVRYLESDRDAAAKLAWANDRFEGLC